ncbi:filamentous haemagglutinin family protein [Janthinobacterium lividum]|uniref:filamentous haemagglutinin family protein n=1 Tax=Janthinobacterium lividum TaxID=29581 RepID=UPI00089349EA|nr:filamentous haemagglutinin family protein [Janthinobacterium lividum]MCC7713064.1 filamentous hemagglutinin family protein [Janthinobacterium lividum]OEZ57416.1 heme/hemopexin-binding protein precursor [Janthinobacterium lividum]WQE31498.1 filamentous hemagglutinin family protein [Janthinobacterium lividum]STQ97026.1 Heme:hemopexin utilization protein A [Janthinobacterium lividum]
MTKLHTAQRPVPTVDTGAQRSSTLGSRLRLTPLAYALTTMLMAGAFTTPARAQQAFSGGWFAAKGAAQNTAATSGRLPNGQPLPLGSRPEGQQQQANQQLQRSLNNLNLAARAIAAQQSAQAQARQAAAGLPGAPDGLVKGGLQVDTNSLTVGWLNAQGPVQTVANGKTAVVVQQTADKAILNWETFNVGKDTTLTFQQQKDWAVLNRVNDPQARPSQIQGQIKADGTVLLVNRNGIVFTGTSQVDTRSLVAAAARVSDTQFQKNGIYSPGTAGASTFTDAAGKVQVQAGARIASNAPKGSTEGGGYVMLLGKEVHNGGEISTPKGQALLAAGDSFSIKKGVGTDGNPLSTTRGSEVVPQFAAGSTAGKVVNTGLIQAREGDVTLAGRTVQQDGVLLATTTTATRGTIHLNALGSDAAVTVGRGAATAILVEDDGKTTALDSQRDAMRGPAVTSTENILAVNDRRDQSRIEIGSAGTVEFLGDSLTLATGGQIAVNAAGRSLVRDGAQLDVSGAVGVKVAMEANNIDINVQGNEQRDAPVNRDGKALINNNIWVDRRKLVFVPKGTNGYDSDRWYTAGGLLEVAGYLGTQGHSVSEWMAQGGTVSFGGKDVVTQLGSSINLSGGTLDVQTGALRQTWLKGADGKLYEAGSAPADLAYAGVYKGYEEEHARWGKDASAFYANPLIAAQKRLENGYTVGRDAGKLVVATGSAVLEGSIAGDVFQGERQAQAPQAVLDGYQQSQLAAAQRGQLIVGQYQPMFDKRTGVLQHALSAVMDEVRLTRVQDGIAAGLDVADVLAAERQGKLLLDTNLLNSQQLGAVRIAAKGAITVDSALQVADGGNITLFGKEVAINASLRSRGGSIAAGNVLNQIGALGMLDTFVNPGVPPGKLVLADGVSLDTSGLLSNVLRDPLAAAGLPYLNGGSVSLRTYGDVRIGNGSLIDVSSGAAILAQAKQQGGKGGNVTLASYGATADLALGEGAQVRGHGVQGGGKLELQANKIMIGHIEKPEAGTVQLDGGFFDKGFSSYSLVGKQGVTVADGTQVDVRMPVLRVVENEKLALWTPEQVTENPLKGTLTQRKGASLAVQVGDIQSGAADMAIAELLVGKNAVVSVDAGQSIKLSSVGQLTVDGRLNAWGGKISLGGVGVDRPVSEAVEAAGHGRSIWIGEHAVLDVAARAVSATDAQGRRYGKVVDGGSIVVGGEIDHAQGSTSAASLFVVVRDGAVLDASGAHAVLDINGDAIDVASAGGSIALASNNGLYLDGQLLARAGGAGAAGGSLSVATGSPEYRKELAQARVLQGRQLILTQRQLASDLAEGISAQDGEQALQYGHGRLSVEQVDAGGFGNLALLGAVTFGGDVTLKMQQSFQLYGAPALAPGSSPDARVKVAAPYVRLASIKPVGRDFYVRPGTAGQTPVARQIGFEGDLIDVRGLVNIVADDVRLTSRGDLRFLLSPLGWDGNQPTTVLSTQGDMTLSAAQLYPETGAGAAVRAGVGTTLGNISYDPKRTLTIARSTDTIPAVPYSAFGMLQFGAAHIEQGGIVRAPLGLINLGVGTFASENSLSINLLPGSITSVSAAGMVMPYGGTADGQSWNVDGKKTEFIGVGGAAVNGAMRVGIDIASVEVAVKPGALLDLSGGGELTGAGFISGRGGSTDARYHPLLQVGANGGFVLPGLATNPVYAIVPGAQAPQAPAGGEKGAADPAIGRQVTIGKGVPGLPAGTYTLMPSTYALLPGAFRVELNGLAGQGASATLAQPLRNGSWAAPGTLSIAGTDIRAPLASQLILTPAKVLRTYSQYNETGYAAFALADAQTRGIPRPLLPADAKTLKLQLAPGAGIDAFQFDGTGKFAAATGGFGGTVSVIPGGPEDIEIVADGASATPDFGGVTLHAASLNAIGAARIVVGSTPIVIYGQGGNYISFGTAQAHNIYLRSGAVLSAPEVLLLARDPWNIEWTAGLIDIAPGAGINTLGRGKVAYDANDGFVYQSNAGIHMLAASNGLMNVAPVGGSARGGISVGVCGDACTDKGTASLYSEGTLLMSTNGSFELDNSARYGTRNLSLAVGAINMGSSEALAAAQANGTRSSGLAMNQGVLDRLLRGDTSTGAPALQALMLSAADSVNFYGDVVLDTYDKTSGKSTLERLVLTTPAMYGQGGADAVATIRTANLIWGGALSPAGNVITRGAGTGSGTLNLEAERIDFGFGPFTQPAGVDSFDRLALGFGYVNLKASGQVTANHKGSLSVYQAQGAYETGKGYQYSGGNLNISTPLLTGDAGSAHSYTAGGALTVAAPAGAAPAAPVKSNDGLGAQLALHGDSVSVATAVVLPSGKLTVSAQHDITVADGARIDMAGRKSTFFDVDKYSWGGDVTLDSRAGDIRQGAGSVIDLSAVNNRAGSLKAVALDGAAGMVNLQGKILGGASGSYDAGGTVVPYKKGSVDVRAQTLGEGGSLDSQFASLNGRLNEGGVTGGRSFQLKQGDLTIGNELKAGEVQVSLDNGRLTVAGVIDASGERVGSIRLAGKHGITLADNAVLDAHGTLLRVDSYGKIIDSPNRAMVELNGGEGLLSLAGGAQIDVRHGTAAVAGKGKGEHDGAARGTLELSAPRLGSGGSRTDADAATFGDIAIATGGGFTVRGAKSIAVNAMQRYDDAAYATDLSASGRPYQVINQAYLDSKHADSTAFIDAALANTNLRNIKLAGLTTAAYAEALHLRPGVDIVSKTPDGDLVVRGDLDLSGMRYASLNPRFPQTAVRGSGEVGSLLLRAGGDLSIYGSINDGFAPPPATQDDKGWILLPGRDINGSDVIVPGQGVTVADGTLFPGGIALNYDLPVKGFNLPANTRLPVAVTLDQPMTVRAGTVLAAAVRDSAGNIVHAAGSLLATEQVFTPGMRLDAGSVLAHAVKVRAMTWPKGVPLPGVAGERGVFVLDGNLALAVGALIPSGMDVKLMPNVESIQLRPEVAGSQGKLWAIAPMLAEGSQAWGLRLVAGADLEAADTRSVQAHPEHATLRLADSHYGVYGVLVPPKGVQYWTREAQELGEREGIPGIVAGEPITEEFTSQFGQTVEVFCANDPTLCVLKLAYVWTKAGAEEFADPSVKAGDVVDLDGLGWPTMCEENPTWCGTSSPSYNYKPSSLRHSVLRTGTGDLDMVSGGDLRVDSLYGVYTAGMSSVPTSASDPFNLPRSRNADGTVLANPDGAHERLVDGGADSIYRAWYPDQGGNLLLKVAGNLSGSLVDAPSASNERPVSKDAMADSAAVGNWLWRQGSGSVATGGPAQPTAWWINFGSYVRRDTLADTVLGFTGFGTLGGGNLRAEVAGDAGVQTLLTGSSYNGSINPRSQGLLLAVGGTGRVQADGSLLLTGGGDLDLRVGGVLNPAGTAGLSHINGALIDLRGHAETSATQLGSLALQYGSQPTQHVPLETRAYDAFTATRATPQGGMTLVPGDATFTVATLGDQVLQDVADPGRVPLFSASAFTSAKGEAGVGYSWFSLWTPRTALDLFSAGGNMTPLTAPVGTATDLAVVYPSIVRVAAPNGSLYYGKATASWNSATSYADPLVLAPSPSAQLEWLAGDSIYAGGYAISQSGAGADSMATPFKPAFVGWNANQADFTPKAGNVSSTGAPATRTSYPLFAFGPDSASGPANSGTQVARIYAVHGDLIGVNSGRIVEFTDAAHAGITWYEGAQPVWMKAGRDIVSSGTALLESIDGTASGNDMRFRNLSNLFVHNNAYDVSLVSAGRDILGSSFNVAGPGTLDISAGRNILMQDKGSIVSLGPIVPGDKRPGAGIAMQAGVGAAGLDYLRFVKPYLDPANVAQTGVPLADQAGKVVKSYAAELAGWLNERYGFKGTAAEAQAFYLALAEPQQRVFARQVYFAELKAGGREFNDADSARYGSFLRSRNAIAGLAPATDASGKAISYAGDITMYRGTVGLFNSDSGKNDRMVARSGYVHTNFGGDIQLLTPGGRQVFGIEGEAPPATSGVITKGGGNIDLFSHGSILLGQSRIMTTFGGDILGWSSQGDINAGRGSKSTIVYTPPKRVYDNWGNVTLSSDVPSTGAGIATLAPIAEVPAGDVDLLAPLGTIDAGEAGIRVSGNVNLAALKVMNAANIQVKGEAKGMPTVASVNVAAMTNASAAATQATAAAQEVVQRERAATRSAQPSVFTVRVLGFGSEAPPDSAQATPADGARIEAADYNPRSAVRVLGLGPLPESATRQLTAQERSRLSP